MFILRRLPVGHLVVVVVVVLRPTTARADKPCEKGKQSRLRYKFFQLQSQYTLADMGLD